VQLEHTFREISLALEGFRRLEGDNANLVRHTGMDALGQGDDKASVRFEANHLETHPKAPDPTRKWRPLRKGLANH